RHAQPESSVWPCDFRSCALDCHVNGHDAASFDRKPAARHEVRALDSAKLLTKRALRGALVGLQCKPPGGLFECREQVPDRTRRALFTLEHYERVGPSGRLG